MALITMTHTIGTVAILIRRRGKVRIPAVVGKIPGVERVQMDVTLVPAAYD
jgi:hypothetical protein